jgi:hypothetical protein
MQLVENLLDESSVLEQTSLHRVDFFTYSHRQSLCYQQLVSEGLTTQKGEKLVGEVEKWKAMAHKSAQLIVSSVLDSIFHKSTSHIILF